MDYGKRSADEETYCICKSKDDKRFMICCDSCNKWFHGDCVDLKAEQAKKIKHYYCQLCQSQKNLSIELKHKLTLPMHGDAENLREMQKKRPKKECGNCIGCFRTEDCGRCDICKNKDDYYAGKKPNCRLRLCVNITPGPSYGKPPPKTKETPKTTKPMRRHNASGAKLKNVSKPESHQSAATVSSNLSTSTSDALLSPSSAPDNDMDKISFTPNSVLGVGTTRAGARAYKSFMLEAGILNDEDRGEELRQCYGPGCVLPARRSSKYCSDETCGLKLARARLLEILPGRLQQWNASPTIAEEFERQRLDHIEAQMEVARQKLSDLMDEEDNLNKWQCEAKQIRWDGQKDTENDDEEGNSICCPTCGHETSAKNALRHINRCFAKYENQTSFGSSQRTLNNVYNIFCDVYNKSSRTYCKRLRVICPEHHKEPKVEDNDICASPLNADQSGVLVAPMGDLHSSAFCKAQKKSCAKHYKWDKIRRAVIDIERLTQLLKLDELHDEQRALRVSQNTRGGVIALLLHQTIKHNEDLKPRVPPAAASAESPSHGKTTMQIN